MTEVTIGINLGINDKDFFCIQLTYISSANIAEVGVRKSPNKKKTMANMLKENRGKEWEGINANGHSARHVW